MVIKEQIKVLCMSCLCQHGEIIADCHCSCHIEDNLHSTQCLLKEFVPKPWERKTLEKEGSLK